MGAKVVNCVESRSTFRQFYCLTTYSILSRTWKDKNKNFKFSIQNEKYILYLQSDEILK